MVNDSWIFEFSFILYLSPSYKDEFPTLGAGSQKPWANTAGAKLIKSSEVSTTFTIPHEEQQKPTLGKGTAAEQGKLVCLRIAKVSFILDALHVLLL